MEKLDTKREGSNSGSNSIRWLLLCLGMIVCLPALWQVLSGKTAEAAELKEQAGQASNPVVTLQAASGASIRFHAQSDRKSGSLPLPSSVIPHLILFHNDELADLDERTLFLTIHGLELPPGGAKLSIRIETQHGDPDLVGNKPDKIVVWQETRWLANQLDVTKRGESVQLKIEFTATVFSRDDSIPTPTDYYGLQIEVFSQSSPDLYPYFRLTQDYAFLLESHWTVPIEEILAGEGPRQLAIYYCDMFPFRKDQEDQSARLPRQAVPDYIQHELLPRMLAAIRLQTQVWGLSFESWTDTGRTQLEVALSDGQTWFHGPPPKVGNSSISINVNSKDNTNYETLSDSLMSTFHHELFHNFQLGLALSEDEIGDFNGKENAWQLFSEGLASFASSIAQTEIQFGQHDSARSYLSKANGFIGGRGFPGDLNSGYNEIDPYHAAVYWRFLYEQCGGMSGVIEDPRAGMSVISSTMQALYSKGVVDYTKSTDLVRGLRAVMDHVFAGPEASACPFRTFAASLESFAQAIYKLRLTGGRCSQPGSPAGCGLYDPHELYSAPIISTITYTGNEFAYTASDQLYPAGIRSSFGMDFIDVQLSSKVDGQNLTLELSTEPDGEANFSVQVIYLLDTGAGWSSIPVQARTFPVKKLEENPATGLLSLTIHTLELDQFNRLGILITRLDADESLDPIGTYTLVLNPG